MPFPRSRRIVRRAVFAVAGSVLLLLASWLAAREPPEIQQSRTIRLGMSEILAEGVMGFRELRTSYVKNPPIEIWLVFGRSTQIKSKVGEFFARIGVPNPLPVEFEDWPVRVRVDRYTGRVDRIERGAEVEESPL